ncbi:hypothetical protein DNTS_034146 [Danionella cerebrum]|uniref:VWFC domain-containing protein n=1 Tax=Danionella cerebrum TaxID=2873325 RepID=A0A553R6V6_9TELE|nr:hypothetical protein DNTS_034146 [Danionella translucida]
MAGLGIYKLDGGGRYPAYCFPIRSKLHPRNEGAGHWLVAHRTALEEGVSKRRNISDVDMKHEKGQPVKKCKTLDEQLLVMLEGLEKFDNVSNMNASDNHLTLEPFGKFSALMELDLSLNCLQNLEFSVEHFQKLKVLDLSFNNITGGSILNLGLLPCLKVLHLSGNHLHMLPLNMAGPHNSPGENTEQDARLYESLEVLMLDDNRLTSPGVFLALANLKRLRYLNLQGNDISGVPFLGQTATGQDEKTGNQPQSNRVIPKPKEYKTGEYHSDSGHFKDLSWRCTPDPGRPFPDLHHLNLANNEASQSFKMASILDSGKNTRLNNSKKARNEEEEVAGREEFDFKSGDISFERNLNAEPFFVTEINDLDHSQLQEPVEPNMKMKTCPKKLIGYELLLDTPDCEIPEISGIQDAVKILDHMVKNLLVGRVTKANLDLPQKPYIERQQKTGRCLPPLVPKKSKGEKVDDLLNHIKKMKTISKRPLGNVLEGGKDVGKREYKEAMSLLKDLKMQYNKARVKRVEEASEIDRENVCSGIFCTFKEKTYRPGDSWHPYLEPFGFMYCMRCSCRESGHVKCNSIKCPALRCENPVSMPQQCCPRCADEQRTPAGLRAPVKTCRYNGTIYQSGETFGNHELFPSRQSNQCVLCSCSNGNIFCALKTCPPITSHCSSPVLGPETCCMVCKGDNIIRHSVHQCAARAQVRGRSVRATPPTLRESPKGLNLQTLHLKGAAETTVKILLQRKHQRACVYSGKTYSHGDAWHPALGRILECILCTCRDGYQECKRITCPNHFPCQHPVKTEGKCCKICPELKAETNQTGCHLPPLTNSVLVYKVEPSLPSQSDNKVRMIAIERHGETQVEVQVWKTVEDTWRKFKEDEENKQRALRKMGSCEDGIRKVVKYLNPEQLDSLCSS